MLPRWENSQVVLHAARGTGNWIGAASALLHGDYINLAYRDRCAPTVQRISVRRAARSFLLAARPSVSRTRW